ncbi:MAG: hypothetical protein NPIRA01_30400 [Nitrospirales bacterium]|nr:MAG: hypothetical protein NPIRA01_30400 [Nitrospirales bacterium]
MMVGSYQSSQEATFSAFAASRSWRGNHCDKEQGIVVKIIPIIEILKERRLGGAKGIVQYIVDDFDTPLSLNL